MEGHKKKCPYVIVQCPNHNCHERMARNLVEEHAAVTCQWRMVSCQFCQKKYPKAEEHIHCETCHMFPLNCSNGCEQVVPREQMSKHLETDCPHTLVSCPYHDLGCNVKVERRNLETHIHEDTTSHLGFACKKLALLQQEFNKENKTLKKQLDDVKKENENLLLKVSAQEKEMQKSKMETPTFVWKVTGFDDILRQAKHGRNNKMDSDPFYTGKYGYKLKLSVNPNGDGSGRNTHLSAFVIVMRGEHDGILPWPFNQKVTFTLVDQQESLDERENVVMHFRANTKLENFARPTAEENPGRGYARFVSHEKLRTRRYLVDDTLFIQVDVGPPSV